MTEDDENKLFVGCLPIDVTEDDLRSVFSTYGSVTKTYMLDKNAEAQGFKAAFVCYSERNAGEDAIKVLNGIYKIRENAERPIQVKWALPKGGAEGKGSQDKEIIDGFKLFVGSLPTDCAEEELQTVFGTYGEVSKVVLMDPNSASGQRCALVFYTTKQAAQDAITVLNGQYKIREDAEAPIVVKWGQDKVKGKDKGGGKGDKGDKGKGDNWSSPYDSGTKGKDAKGKDAKSKGKGKDSGSSWQSGQGKSWQDNTWQAPQNSWQDSSKGKGKKDSWQDSSWQGGQSWGASQGNSWSGSSWSGGDGGGSNWGQGHDKGGKGGGKDSKGAKGDKGGCDGGKGGQGASGGGKGGTRLFIANLPADIGNDAVQYVFQTYGKVQNVHIMSEKPGKGGSVAGFVQYETADEATTAVASLNDKYEIREGFGMLKVKLANDRAAPY